MDCDLKLSQLKKFQFNKRGVGLSLLLVFLLSACDSAPQTTKQSQFSYSDWIMGTTFNIKIPELPNEVDGEQLKVEIMSLLVEIDGKMSTYKKDSELSILNANPATEKTAVSASLYKVLHEAQRISELSGGAFDITIGKLVNLWGFGPDKAITEPPSEQVIDQALQKAGYANLILDRETLSIEKRNSQIYIDLSALAKGYAVDQIAEHLENKLITDFLVEIGGELKLKGHNKDNKAWRIAIEKPIADSRDIQTVIEVTDIAIASSGDYRNFFEQNDKRYSHTIDPRTGRSITHNLVSVTVLDDSTMTADAMATTFMVLGAKKGLVLAEREKISAIFYVKSDNGFIEYSSSKYKKFLKVKS